MHFSGTNLILVNVNWHCVEVWRYCWHFKLFVHSSHYSNSLDQMTLFDIHMRSIFKTRIYSVFSIQCIFRSLIYSVFGFRSKLSIWPNTVPNLDTDQDAASRVCFVTQVVNQMPAGAGMTNQRHWLGARIMTKLFEQFFGLMSLWCYQLVTCPPFSRNVL